MKKLYGDMERWQNENLKRFLSTDVQRDENTFCCIALTNPSEVTIVDKFGRAALVTEDGAILAAICGQTAPVMVTN